MSSASILFALLVAFAVEVLAYGACLVTNAWVAFWFSLWSALR